MAGNVLNFYAGGNTARGFYSLYESTLKGLDRLFILKGGPGTGKSSLMKEVGQTWLDKGFDIQFLHCSSDNESIDGVIIPSLKVGIVDGTAPHVIEPKAPGVIEEYVNLGIAWNSDQLVENKGRILEINKEMSEAFQAAYTKFNEGLEIHDEREQIYIGNMDFTKADEILGRLIDSIFGEETTDKEADVRHRFLGAATPKGPVDFIQNLTEELPTRYFVKGRPGTGKSTMLKKLVSTAEERGFDVEVYHCGLDPHSLDMVIVRDLGVAVFDSTAPHEYFPEREGDTIVDMYAEAVTPGTDEKYTKELEDINNRYSVKMKEGTALLAKAKELHDELEEFYVKAMDFAKVEEIKGEIQREILKLEKVANR